MKAEKGQVWRCPLSSRGLSYQTPWTRFLLHHLQHRDPPGLWPPRPLPAPSLGITQGQALTSAPFMIPHQGILVCMGGPEPWSPTPCPERLSPPLPRQSTPPAQAPPPVSPLPRSDHSSCSGPAPTQALPTAQAPPHVTVSRKALQHLELLSRSLSPRCWDTAGSACSLVEGGHKRKDEGAERPGWGRGPSRGPCPGFCWGRAGWR